MWYNRLCITYSSRDLYYTLYFRICLRADAPEWIRYHIPSRASSHIHSFNRHVMRASNIINLDDECSPARVSRTCKRRKNIILKRGCPSSSKQIKSQAKVINLKAHLTTGSFNIRKIRWNNSDKSGDAHDAKIKVWATLSRVFSFHDHHRPKTQHPTESPK